MEFSYSANKLKGGDFIGPLSTWDHRDHVSKFSNFIKMAWFSLQLFCFYFFFFKCFHLIYSSLKMWDDKLVDKIYICTSVYKIKAFFLYRSYQLQRFIFHCKEICEKYFWIICMYFFLFLLYVNVTERIRKRSLIRLIIINPVNWATWTMLFLWLILLIQHLPPDLVIKIQLGFTIPD